ncbi:MAG: hypothetical protein KKG09_06770 [Verrucomicrobia bacterium]|nr:hypothetical protein [Verrucomicrobiota bacterium]MBU4247191.1 hypothetical protein [Verrucomicrobiota bacterium]MBU4291362.1 hypothetical protein [Verrucomicrobiota bacterium]MBU4497686.1 hypothetical protein [Verrucomicrobiota bacterium]MCG2680674.1 hypothetical protein [Kiritimatiellia bacterium]
MTIKTNIVIFAVFLFIVAYSSGQNTNSIGKRDINRLAPAELSKGVTTPSDASRKVQSNIIGQWVCLTNIPGINKRIQYIHFRSDGAIEYKQNSGNNLLNKTESYKIIHKGEDKNCPGKKPNILITNLSDTNGIFFIEVSVGYDSRVPMEFGELLKFSDIEGGQYLFIKQENVNKIK